MEKIPSHVVTIGMTGDDRAEGNGSYVGATMTWLSPYTALEAFALRLLSLPTGGSGAPCTGEVWSPLSSAFRCWTTLPPAGTSW